ILPEGVTAIGANSGVGKTYWALQMAKALVTGEKFLGRYNVKEPRKVLYLIPEVGDRALRKRLEKLQIPLDGTRIRVRTMADGIMRLDDQMVLDAAKDWKPVVFIDTSIRFTTAKDENSAAENATLADALFAILRAGAKAVVPLHHAPKGTANADEL